MTYPFGKGLNPAPKLASALLMVLSINLMGRLYWPSFGVVIAALVLWCALDGVGPWSVLKRSVGFFPFLLMVVLFGPRGVGFDEVSLAMLAKGSISALTLAVLTCSTPFHKLLEGMSALRFPPLLSMILAFMYRYLSTLLEEAKRMERARNLRFFGKGYGGQVRVLGYIIGSLFIRGYERGERVYTAMRLRGYDGGPSAATHVRPGPVDFVLLAMSVLSLLVTGVDLLWR